jgi:tetratricopeptide (TPR) repeat protein
MYAEQGRLDEAERLARIALRILPQRPEPSDTLGWVLYRQGRYSAAAQQFQLALKAAPTRGMYQYHLGLALTKDGRPDGGAALRRALELGLSAADADAARAALLNDGAHRVR